MYVVVWGARALRMGPRRDSLTWFDVFVPVF
jgi:hypothetical protein